LRLWIEENLDESEQVKQEVAPDHFLIEQENAEIQSSSASSTDERDRADIQRYQLRSRARSPSPDPRLGITIPAPITFRPELHRLAPIKDRDRLSRAPEEWHLKSDEEKRRIFELLCYTDAHSPRDENDLSIANSWDIIGRDAGLTQLLKEKEEGFE
jgi:hypothetical protein